jgi:hypothetical protein
MSRKPPRAAKLHRQASLLVARFCPVPFALKRMERFNPGL